MALTYIPDYREVKALDPKPTSLRVIDGVLNVRLTNGESHQVFVRADDQVVKIGCLETTREALKMIAAEIKAQDRFQKRNASRLMATLRRSKSK
jgi:hypothetical protein